MYIDLRTNQLPDVTELDGYSNRVVPGEPALLAGMFHFASASGGRKRDAAERSLQPGKVAERPVEIIPVDWPLEVRSRIPQIIYRAPEIKEEIIQTLPFVNGNALLVVIFKGNQGNEAQEYRQERLQLDQESSQVLMEYIRQYGLQIVFGNDVMSYIWVDGKMQVEFKPPADASKDDIWVGLWKKIGMRPQDDPEGILTTTWESSFSLQETTLDIQIVRHLTHEVKMRRASNSFLNALIFGVEDSEHPVDEETRENFLRLYLVGTPYSIPNHREKPHRHAQDLFGWTPEGGMPLENLRSINAGRKGDSLFFMDLLVTEIDGVEKADPRFGAIASKAIPMVRGLAIDLPYMLRRLVEIIASFKTLADVENFRGDERFQELARQYGAIKDQYPDLVDTRYSGRTVDLSGEYAPIDWILYLAFIKEILDLPGIDIATSGIIQ